MMKDDARACIDCAYFIEDESWQRFGWFGLRSKTTIESMKYARCGVNLFYANISRNYNCLGENFKPKGETQ